MRFSVVIPLYNKEMYIKETLDSVKTQSFRDFEVIVVNDSSTDKSLNIASVYESDNRYHVYTIPNGGVSAARNFGIGKAKGDYVCFLDADDLWQPNYLEEADRLLKKHGERNFLCFAYDSFLDSPGNIIGHRNLRTFFSDEDRIVDFYRYSVLTKCSVALTSSVIIKNKRLKELDHWFPVGVSMGEDVDLWVRTAAAEDIIYSNKALMLYRMFADGCLTKKAMLDLDKSYHYWEWYKLPCYSSYKDLFTTRMLYAVARKGLGCTSGKSIREWLRRISGTYLLYNRVVLFVFTFLK